MGEEHMPTFLHCCLSWPLPTPLRTHTHTVEFQATSTFNMSIPPGNPRQPVGRLPNNGNWPVALTPSAPHPGTIKGSARGFSPSFIKAALTRASFWGCQGVRMQ